MRDTQDTGTRSSAASGRRATWRWSATVAALVIAVAACGSDSDSGSDTAATSTVLLTAPTTVAGATATTVAGATATTVAGTTAGTTPASDDCPTYNENEELPLVLCDTGTMVTELQQALADAGLDVVVDGFFGPQTESAVQIYQANNNLEVDGLVGPLTWANLFPEDAPAETTTTTG